MIGMYVYTQRPGGAQAAAARLRALAGPDAVPPSLLMLLGMVSTQVGAATAKELFAAASVSGATALRLSFGGCVVLASVGAAHPHAPSRT